MSLTLLQRSVSMSLVINLFGGPCSGKSTLAASIFAEMKAQGKSVELAFEFAKDLVYDKQIDLLQSKQCYVFAHQQLRIDRLINSGVDYIITDSPLLLSVIYNHYTTSSGQEF